MVILDSDHSKARVLEELETDGPLISVIIPTHSRPRLLARAFESARAAGARVEVVVVDDASRDETAAVCRALSTIKYIRLEQRRGVAGARNAGLGVSSGEYVAFLDDDDVRLPGSLDAQARVLDREEEIALVYGQAILGDQNCEPTANVYPRPCPQGDVFWPLLERNFIPCPSALFRRSCLSRVGFLDESIPGVDDWDLWLRMAERHRVAAIERPVAVHRRATPSSDQYSARAAELVALATRAHRTRWMKLERAAAGSAEERRRAAREFSTNMANHLMWEAGRSLACGRLRAAVQSISTAARLHPLGALRGAARPSNPRRLTRAAREHHATKNARLSAAGTE